MRRSALVLIVTLMACQAMAADIRVAVAANFRGTLEKLAPEFQQMTGHSLVMSAGSTGVLFAQIQRGAPFDVFLAADDERPEALLNAGVTLGPPVRYATGRLVMIYAKGVGASEARPLDDVRTIAIATPRTAPYGAAAMEFFAAFPLGPDVRLARMQSVAGVNAAVASGAADAGLAAWSSVPDPKHPNWLVPRVLHKPIHQTAVVLARARDPDVAQDFLAWLTGDLARAIISANGYDVD